MDLCKILDGNGKQLKCADIEGKYIILHMAADKDISPTKSIDVFFLFLHENLCCGYPLAQRHFWWVPTT